MAVKYGEIQEATCDACGADLLDVERWREDGDPSKPERVHRYLNRSVLENHFGWPDPEFDYVTGSRPCLDLCRDCTRKALAAIGVSTAKFCGA